jgi:hypothetical protein
MRIKKILSRRRPHRVVSPHPDAARSLLSIRRLRRACRAFWRVYRPPPCPF